MSIHKYAYLSDQSSSLGWVRLGAIVILSTIIAGCCYGIYSDWNDERLSPSWPCVQGEMLEGASIESSPSKSSGGYGFICRYRFVVDGQPYESGRCVLGDNRVATREEAKRLSYGLEKGKQVKVWYRPQMPSYSILRHSKQTMSYPYTVFGLCALSPLLVVVFPKIAELGRKKRD